MWLLRCCSRALTIARYFAVSFRSLRASCWPVYSHASATAATAPEVESAVLLAQRQKKNPPLRICHPQLTCVVLCASPRVTEKVQSRCDPECLFSRMWSYSAPSHPPPPRARRMLILVTLGPSTAT